MSNSIPQGFLAAVEAAENPKTAKYSADLQKLEHDATAKNVDQKTLKDDSDQLMADAKAAGIDTGKVQSALDDIEQIAGKAGHGDAFAKDIKDLADIAHVGNPMDPPLENPGEEGRAAS